MRGLDASSARRLVLAVAGIYIVALGIAGLLHRAEAIDSVTLADFGHSVTSLASLALGGVIGLYLASFQTNR